MTRRVLASHLVLTAFVVVVLAVPLGVTVARGERARLVAAVERDAVVLAALVEDVLEHSVDANLDEVAAEYARRTDSRAVIVDARGVTVGDSAPLGEGRRDLSTRPEVAEALQGRISSGDRYSRTLEQGLLYVAVPVTSGGRVHGAVRITYPTAEVDVRIHRAWLMLALVAGVALLAAGVVAAALARSVTRPVARLLDAATHLAHGDLSARAEAGRGPEELRRLAAALNGMAERLEGLLDTQRAFVADASHQLRTPLTALRLRLEGLEGLPPAALAAEVDAALDEVARLARLVDGLLTLVRAEGTGSAPEPVDVSAVLEDRLAAWQPLAEESGVRLESSECDVPPALAVPGALEQILDNYLANALQVAPPGSVVQLTAESAGDTVRVSVVDEGPGLDPQDRLRAFDRFWRGRSDNADGFGIGLAIVRRLAAAGGGEASLDEGPGGIGTRASLRLPAADVPSPQTPNGRAAR